MQIQSGETYTTNCATYWVDFTQRICLSYPYVDVIFTEQMAQTPQILVSDKMLFPFTPCAAGASDAMDHVVTNVTRYGFRLYGGASPASNTGCGESASNARAVSLFSWLALSKK